MGFRTQGIKSNEKAEECAVIEHLEKLQPDGLQSTSIEYQECFGVLCRQK